MSRLAIYPWVSFLKFKFTSTLYSLAVAVDHRYVPFILFVTHGNAIESQQRLSWCLAKGERYPELELPRSNAIVNLSEFAVLIASFRSERLRFPANRAICTALNEVE